MDSRHKNDPRHGDAVVVDGKDRFVLKDSCAVEACTRWSWSCKPPTQIGEVVADRNLVRRCEPYDGKFRSHSQFVLNTSAIDN